MAARLDEIPQPGDHTVYEIGNQSVLLVRVDCRHCESLSQRLSASRYRTRGMFRHF